MKYKEPTKPMHDMNVKEMDEAILYYDQQVKYHKHMQWLWGTISVLLVLLAIAIIVNAVLTGRAS